MNPLLIALALSATANAFLGWQWLEARDAAAIAGQQRAQAQTAAGTCSKGVEDMRARAVAADKLAAAGRAAAAARAADAGARADVLLSSPQAVPGDACASARADIDAWLGGRAP